MLTKNCKYSILLLTFGIVVGIFLTVGCIDNGIDGTVDEALDKNTLPEGTSPDSVNSSNSDSSLSASDVFTAEDYEVFDRLSDKSTLSSEEVDASGVGYTSSEFHFSGTSKLPDDACLRGQLFIYQDGKYEPLPWWPYDECLKKGPGSWEIELEFGEDGIPDSLEPEGSYVLYIWKEGEPEIMDNIVLELSHGPRSEG